MTEYVKAAVSKAVGAGWRWKGITEFNWAVVMDEDDALAIRVRESGSWHVIPFVVIASQPSFWRCLGYAMHWNINCVAGDGDCRNAIVPSGVCEEHWREKAYEYFRLALSGTGEDMIKFWKGLDL